MLHILQKLIFTTLFAVFAAQANAMWISPDWWDVTQPGVGTNRYAYSHGDPINLRDPSGNATVYRDTDGDGLNEYYGEINPGDLGWGDDFSSSGVQPSEWVDINNAFNSGGSYTFSGGENATSYPVQDSNWFTRTFGPKLSFANPHILATDPTLAAIWRNRKSRSVMYQLMLDSNYLATRATQMVETGGWFTYNTQNGAISFSRAPNGTFNTINLPAPPSTRGPITFAHIHTHPSSGLSAVGANGNGQSYTPAPADIRGAAHFGYSGFVVNNRLDVYGYSGSGF